MTSWSLMPVDRFWILKSWHWNYVNSAALTALAVDNSEIADFKLHFYNADGSRGEMCGNGSRCVAKFAYDHGIAPENMTIETDAGLLTADRISENQYRVRLNNPGIVDLHRSGDMAYVELLYIDGVF